MYAPPNIYNTGLNKNKTLKYPSWPWDSCNTCFDIMTNAVNWPTNRMTFNVYEGHSPIHSQVIAHSKFWASRVMWSWPLMNKHKINRGHLLLMTTSIPSMKILGQSVLKLLTGQGFDLQCYCDFNLWPRNIKINRGHLLIMTNLNTKLEDPRLMCYQVIDRTRFWPSMSLWPWHLTKNPKFNMGHLLVMTNHYTKLEVPWTMSSLVIGRTRCVYGPTADQPTDRHVQSNIPPLLRRVA